MAAAAAMTPSMAEAQFTGSGGAYVSFTFGDQIGVGWGLEGAFGGYIEMDGGCDDCDGAVVGPVLQLGWINLEELRLAAWLQAGGEVAENTGIVGEVGIVGHILDPGVGFAKTYEQNFAVLAHVPDLIRFECPVLIGVSRKSFIGKLFGHEVDDRHIGSLAAGLDSVRRGAHMLRVHDVREHKEAISMWEAIDYAAD